MTGKLAELWIADGFLGHKRGLFKFLLNINNWKKKFGNHEVGQMDTYLYDIDSGIPLIFKLQKFQFFSSAM